MLEFQKQILTEIVAEDGLLILSKGLGLFNVLCSFIQLHCTGKHLVLVLNTTPQQIDLVKDTLIANEVPPDRIIQAIEYDTPADTRNAMYRSGGVFSITSRILAVDMLLKRIPIALITGIIVYNAHRVKSNSMEELILRIYREENQEGFIKAFSDQPEAFVTGFAPLQNTLKSLQLRKVHLWPRFQVLVSDNLSDASEDVVELRQPMTLAMEKIQQSLVECLESTLAEIRRSTSMIDVEDFTVENAFFKSFDMIVRRQLDPIWHRISPTTKQLVGDLKVLRQLLSYLTSYDCVSFYSFLETVIASNASQDGKQVRQSQWLFLEAADTAITTARLRFYLRPTDHDYKLTDIPASIGSSSIPDKLKLVLEEQPKWNLLGEILKEIEQDAKTTNDGQSAPVLIMVNEKRTCSQLKEYLSRLNTETGDTNPVLNRLAKNFFKWRGTMNQIQKAGGLSFARPAATTNSPSAGPSTGRGAPPNKRRRVRGGSTTAALSGDRAATLSQTFREDIQENLQVLDNPEEEEEEGLFQAIDPSADQAINTITLGANDILPEFEPVPPKRLITIQHYDNDTDEQVLQDVSPRFIIMYDPDPAFVRRIEVYRAMHPNVHVQVYFMLYDNSVEEQNYLSLIRKEKEAFESLIREKSIMAIPLPQKAGNPEDTFVRAVSSRVAGGQLKVAGPPQVIVDMREFRSSLPPILYAEGVKILPYTLQVGDYILSPEMCVERKSIADLIQSFRSGRLYTQCENMCLYYKKPILLIEFDQSKSFSLQSLSDMKSNIVLTDLSSKLVLLTLTFPKIRIIWSSSPHETAAVFKELKKTSEEPSADAAAAVGAEGTEEMDTTHNMTPQEILRNLPGITSKNYRIIMSNMENLEELTNSTEDRIQKLIGEEPGRKLYRFLHQRAGTES
ncbi:uncharacterized protein BYT42DRAFT_584566 [Radiomyces spectabilis]|uniref:uncharacterized protein n=1 Tax=Radiomyces spectabilis TaxID=64574 RepID=UPI00221F67FF|nr:uncharacterized protein BYT42DRAFT_584566 [Radiomyces spectabilis]KAI8369465.1 hypothetical protein BYT42DRAFT_584566 [Radiomyces spectabilis]